MKDKNKAPYGKGKMEKPMPGMQNRPGKMMAPKPAMPMKPKPAPKNSKMEALKGYMKNMKKGKK